MESWRKIDDCEYEVSDWGNVRRVGSARNLKACDDSIGRFSVCLCKNGIPKKYTVHRLVATAFLENPENLPQVDHIDRNPQNNRLENLRWCSRSQNCCNRITKNKNGFSGVYKEKQKYASYITINGKKTFIGTFHTPEQAHEAYKKKKNEVAGEFSPFNVNVNPGHSGVPIIQ
jgi:hypothetical protein